ncbi:MAG: Gfo/Idh/MocA family oxidoreductase [Gemmatimonadota bacterium]
MKESEDGTRVSAAALPARAENTRNTVLSELVQELRQRAEAPALSRRRPQVGFAGAEWSRHSRLRDLVAGGLVDVRCIADSDHSVAEEAVSQVQKYAPDIRAMRDVDHLLNEPLDGVVITMPLPTRGVVAREALARRMAVFSQYPIAGNAADTEAIVASAHQQDLLLTVDFYYRHVPGVAEMTALLRDGAIGDVYAIELRSHTSYGPDSPGDDHAGCLRELGSHLLDLVLHVLDTSIVADVSGRRYASGRQLASGQSHIAEDYAVADFTIGDGIPVHLACSWRASLGQDATIEASFVGTRGSMRLSNVDGALGAFRVEHCEGVHCRTLGGTSDAWGGRMATAWARELAAGAGFNAEAARIAVIARIIDRIVGRSLS